MSGISMRALLLELQLYIDLNEKRNLQIRQLNQQKTN